MTDITITTTEVTPTPIAPVETPEPIVAAVEVTPQPVLTTAVAPETIITAEPTFVASATPVAVVPAIEHKERFWELAAMDLHAAIQWLKKEYELAETKIEKVL